MPWDTENIQVNIWNNSNPILSMIKWLLCIIEIKAKPQNIFTLPCWNLEENYENNSYANDFETFEDLTTVPLLVFKEHHTC